MAKAAPEKSEAAFANPLAQRPLRRDPARVPDENAAAPPERLGAPPEAAGAPERREPPEA